MSYTLFLFEDSKQIEAKPVSGEENNAITKIGAIYCRLSKQKYIEQINKLLVHIKRGDIYEINYCIEFFCEDAVINPQQVFKTLNELTEAPFAQLLKAEDDYIICASPERFIQKKGHTLISQPMKGTARRSAEATKDLKIKTALQHSLKEQTENVMALDVARNDLSQVATKGSVVVTELFGVHTFKNVHQMLSTVSCNLKENTTLNDIIKATFPPASMTGAPKLKAIELIKKYELSLRGIYSGTLGFINENGDFDFCVVIRTIIYNEKIKRLSFHVGSAITAQCNPEEEWNECLLKAETLFKALGTDIKDVVFAE
ncbi:MAG TPA: anthranilate synthase component I family protein [Bacteroidia bacterium]|nr:anthranilate synthase component I family protein [Bacteroidia bacterium]